MRYFDYLSEFAKYDGILPNLFTEISTSKVRAMASMHYIITSHTVVMQSCSQFGAHVAWHILIML